VVLCTLSCRNNDLQREEALKESGKFLMEEPEVMPIVQTIRDLNQTLQDINSSLRGEGGDFQMTIETVNSTLTDVQNQISNLRNDLEIQKESLKETRLSYEALAESP